MIEPHYKPSTWIAYLIGTEGGFGQITGGAYDGTQWYYMVSGSHDDGSLRSVPECAVTYSLQNGSWMAPTSTNGQNSAYAAPEAS